MTTSMAAAAGGNGEMAGLDYDEQYLACSPTLRFSVGTYRFGFAPDAVENARRLIAAVDSAVAARADVEALEASFVYYDPSPANFQDTFGSRGYMFRHDHAVDITSAHLARWLRFAASRVTGSFVLSVPTVPPPPRMLSPEVLEMLDGDGVPRMSKSGVVRRHDAAAVREIRELYAELPASSRAETVRLTLGDAEMTVPVAGAGAFGALTDLFLSHCIIDTGEDANLGRMLSSACCPRLRRLRLEQVAGLHALRLEAAGTLEELLLDHVKDVSVLEVDAPGLQSLHLLNCSEISEVSVSAPALETLHCLGVPQDSTELDGAASIRRLEKLFFWSHGFPPEGHQEFSYSNADVAWLLDRCAAVETLDVSIWAPPPPVEDRGGTAELIGLLPCLPAVTNLSIDAWVTASDGPGHRLGHSVARLVARCGSLQRLAVEFSNQFHFHGLCEDPNCFCSPPAPEMVVMEQLVEAKIVGFRPLEDQVSLVRVLIAKAPALERMKVQFQWAEEDDGEGALPCDRGHWAPSAPSRYGEPVYEWTPAAP